MDRKHYQHVWMSLASAKNKARDSKKGAHVVPRWWRDPVRTPKPLRCLTLDFTLNSEQSCLRGVVAGAVSLIGGET